VTEVGDLWSCGPHRALCGDATSEEAVRTLLGGVAPALMVTDPPYGVELDPQWRERAGLGKQRQTGVVPNDDRVDWRSAYKLFTGNVAYVWPPECMQRKWRLDWKKWASESGLRSSGPSSTLRWAAEIITGAMSLRGTRSEKASRPIGVVIVRSQRCGKSPT